MKDVVVVMKTKALTGVGPRGLRPGHIKGLFRGSFSDPEAKQARESFEELGLLYLDGGMPCWLRCALTSGLLTPLVKKLPEHGEAPDARPTNAPDIDVSIWWKTLQRSVNPAVRKLLTPQQLGVAVMNGTQIKVIGAALKIEQAREKGSPYAHGPRPEERTQRVQPPSVSGLARTSGGGRRPTASPCPRPSLDLWTTQSNLHARAARRPRTRPPMRRESWRTPGIGPHQCHFSRGHQLST